MIKHVFVLMLENRSFDHMLGWSGLGEGLSGTESNPLAGGATTSVSRGAPFALDVDPPHEFDDVLEQLAGPGARYQPGSAYPPVINSGFASRFAARYPEALKRYGFVTMAGFTEQQLPVMSALARAFGVCDRWFSSVPGPTWPNRLFAHAASSAGLDASPSARRSVTAILDGYRFRNGTVYDRLSAAGHSWYIVEGDALPQSLALHGMVEHAMAGRFLSFHALKERLKAGSLDATYVFIEPDYGHVLADGRNFKCGNSQHAQDDITRGEALIKETYESIRSSPLWNDSLLILTHDEHGGFFDHVPPPRCAAPGDGSTNSENRHGFTFEQLGVRVPAVIVSPWIEAATIDHRVHDHSSISATLDELFGVGRLTARDAAVDGVAALLTRSSPRDDAPMTLPAPAASGIPDCDESLLRRLAGAITHPPTELAGPAEAALIGFLHVAAVRELHLAAVGARSVERALQTESGRIADLLGGALDSKHGVARLVHDVATRYRASRPHKP